MVERDVLPAFVSRGREEEGGIPRARRDKDMKGAERMERKSRGGRWRISGLHCDRGRHRKGSWKNRGKGL